MTYDAKMLAIKHAAEIAQAAAAASLTSKSALAGIFRESFDEILKAMKEIE